MPASKTWNGTTYSIPLAGELNWSSLSTFLQDLATSAGTTTSALQSVRVATTTPVTLLALDATVVTNLTTPGPVAVNLPTGVTKQIYRIVDGKGDAGTNAITITPSGGALINGGSTLVLNVNRAAVVIQFDGTNWDIVAYYPGIVSAGDVNQNYVMNGNFLLQQRGGFNSVNTVYNLDRWINSFGGTVGTISLQSTGYAGTNSVGCARLAASGAGTTEVNIFQPNETLATAALIGKQVTLSCLVRKSASLAAGSFTISVRTTTTSDDTFANQANGAEPFIGTVTAASMSTSFALLSVTGVIPSTARSICVKVSLNGTPTASQYVEVTDVVLNLGAVPAPYSFAGRTVEGETALCQRYYEKSYAIGQTQGAAVTAGCVSVTADNTGYIPGVQFKVTKRVTPTVTIYSTNGVTNKVSIMSTGGDVANTGTIGNASQSGFNRQTAAATFTAGVNYSYHFTAEAEIV